MNGATVTHLTPNRMTPSTARQLTDSIKIDAENLWKRLLRAYEQGAHTSLGYSNWREYCKAEFNLSQSRAYQLIDAGKVVRAIKTHSTAVESPKTEAIARKLTPILRQKGDGAVAEAWVEAVEKHGPEPTAEEVEEVVRAMGDEPTPPPTSKLTKEQEQFARALRHIETSCEYVSAVLAGRRLDEKERARRVLDIDEETRAAWSESIKTIHNAARQLQRRVIERRLP